MTEEVKPEVIKKTQEVLGKFIKKPNLSEKLLKKPPFRFLHDICTSVMKETGFFEGVLNSPDDKFENIKDKEGKIEFLQKVIAAVEAANGVRLTVKPNKIVAGLEATKTNEFLQSLGKALEKQAQNKSSKTALSTKAKSTKKQAKEEPPDKKKTPSSRNSKRIVENGVHEPNDVKTKLEENKSPTSPKKKHAKEVEEVAQQQNGNPEKNINNGFADVKSPERKEKVNSRSYGAGESIDMPDVDFIRVNGPDGQGDQNLMSKEEVIQNSEQRKGHSGKHKSRRSSIHIEQTKPTEEENEKPDATGNDKANVLNKSEIILKEQNRSTPSPPGPPNYSKKDTNHVREGTLISRPRTGIRPTTARPASARPAAPRIRDRGDIAVTEEVIKPASGKVAVIVDEETANDAEEETLISLETTNDIQLEEPVPIIPPTNSNTEQEHGHLVEQILEVQRELEDDSRFSEQKTTGKTEIEWESGRNGESTSRELEKLRASIQALTRTANPLGKLLDFFQEDVEIVQKELESWKEKNSSYCLQIAQEKSITEKFVEPLKIHLKELQQSIEEQMEQISVVKANIIRNNEKIQKLLAGL